jgi:hypothetical protein
MGLLGSSYTNRSMGVDLLQNKRPCIYFANDTQLGCINDDFFYMRNLTSNQDFLYDLKKDIALSPEDAGTSTLKQYAISMMTVSEFLIKNGETTSK